MQTRNAAITWDSTGDTVEASERVHMLERPLETVKPAHSMQRYRRESLDRSVTEVFNVSSGAQELVGLVGLDRSGHSLIDLVKAGSKGKTLTYYPDLTDAGVSYACELIAPVSPSALQSDNRTGNVRGDFQVELRLRQTDQGAFTPLDKGSDVLFWFRGGESLEDATYSRGSVATYVTNGFGQLSTAASGVARTAWFSSVSSEGPRLHPTLLLEDARTNLMPESENFGAWDQGSTPTVTSGQADPYGGSAAYLIADTSTSNTQFVEDGFTIVTTGTHALSLFVRAGSTMDPAGQSLHLRNNTAAVNYADLAITWSSGIPATTVVTGSTYAPPERYANGWWRVSVIADGTTNTADTHVMQFRPSSSPDLGELYVFGAQLEST